MRCFLIEALRHPDFLAGKIDTGFIAGHPELIPEAKPQTADVLALAALFVVKERAMATAALEHDPWNIGDAFRLGSEGREVMEFQSRDTKAAVTIVYRRAGGYWIETGKTIFEGDGELGADGALTAILNGKEIAATVVRTASGVAVMMGGHTHILAPLDALAHADEHAGDTDAVRAPMPGRVVQLLVKKGDHVKRGGAIAVLEAMKMEHTLAAPADVTITSVSVGQGDQVVEGAIIAKLKPQA